VKRVGEEDEEEGWSEAGAGEVTAFQVHESSKVHLDCRPFPSRQSTSILIVSGPTAEDSGLSVPVGMLLRFFEDGVNCGPERMQASCAYVMNGGMLLE